jgi:protein tyrosine/serine phosphatase
MTDEDLSHLDNLPVTRVIDYRDPHEVQRSPDRLNGRMRYLNAPANPLTPASMPKSRNLTPRRSMP